MTLNAKFVAGGHVSPGLVVHLTYGQFDARRHLLKARGDVHKGKADKRRLPYTAEKMLFFKAGEEIGIDGMIDRQLQSAIDASDEQVVAAGGAKPGVIKAVGGRKSAAVKKAEKVLKDAEADAAEAQVTLDSAAPDDRVAAQQALDTAKAAVASAQEALTKAEG